MLLNVATVSFGLLLVASSAVAVGPSAVNLASAGNYVILGKTGISTVSPSTITGNIAVSPIGATAITGFSLTLDSSGTFATSSQVTGKVFAATYVSPTPSTLTTAILDMQAAFTDATGRVNPDHLNLASGLIGGLTLAPGLYKWTSGVSAATGFTISGSATDTWIFQIAGTFILETGVRVSLAGGALDTNIVWVVAGAVTCHVGTHLEGVVLGKTGITLQTGTSLNGRALAQANVVLQVATVKV